MSAYTVIAGDTLERISRRMYGSDVHATDIEAANPQVTAGVLIPGQKLEVPEIDNLPPAVSDKHFDEASESEVSVSVGGETFRFWDSVRITRAIDKPAVLSLGAPFEPSNVAFRSVFAPLSYRPVTVNVAGTRLFTGVTVTPNPEVSANSRTATVDAYAQCALLGDCTLPASSYAAGRGVEFNGLSVLGIALALGKPFGITVTLDGDAGATFDRVSLDPEVKVLEFIIELCKQRVLVISSDERGMLVLQDETDSKPVASLEESPLVTVSAQFNPQEYYSHITCISPSSFGVTGGQFTIMNPHLSGSLRPFVFRAPDALESDVVTACKAKAARMFAGAATYSVTLPGWRDPSGNLWEPNTRLRLKAVGAMIYDSYDFLIRSVTNTSDKDTSSTDLDLVLPGSFGGAVPDILPWSNGSEAALSVV